LFYIINNTEKPIVCTFSFHSSTDQDNRQACVRRCQGFATTRSWP